MRRLLLAWRLAWQMDEGRLVNELLRAQLDGRQVPTYYGSELNWLFAVLVRGREHV